MTVTRSSPLHGERRFELLVNAVRDYAIYLLDPDGNVASWNAGAERFKGYRPDEVIGSHFSRFYTEEDRKAGLPAEALRRSLEAGSFEAEGWRVRKDGSRFWTSVIIDPVFDDAGQHVGFAKVTRDITEKREAQRALLESEQRFRILVQGVQDYAIYLLDPEGYVTNWNSGAEAIKGYAADEIVGQHFSRFYTEEDRQAGEPGRALDIARNAGKFEIEAWRVRKDGSRFRAGVLIDAIHDEAGALIGFAKVTRDLTERWDAQQEIERAREAVAQAQKMEAVGRLTGGVAHDFNNLLTVIRSSADMLKLPTLPAEKREAYVEAIAETAERAAALTGQLLAFARRQPLKPEAFDAGLCIDGMVDLMRTSVGSTVELAIDTGKSAEVRADPHQFETALLNLVVNARDAMPAGGRVSVTTRTVERLPPIRGHAGAEGNFIAVEVADTGNGIAPDILANIFEPFFTTKAPGKGTGLGLSQVHGFAKQSGGDIDVRSEIAAGTVFTLYLPVAARSAAELPAEPEKVSTRPPTRRILLVEDNETVGRFSRGLFEELGQIVTWVENGEAALALLEKAPDRFDLIFSDVVMPGINGLDLARMIARRWPALRVVLTSGYSEVLAQEGEHKFELLRKPYSLGALLQILGQPTRV